MKSERVIKPTGFIRLGKLEPLNVAKVPVFRGMWVSMGSGLIWASMAMGSGELIWWPYLTAKYGAAFIGILLPACIMQYFVNQEIARYTATTGEGLFQGFARLHYVFVVIMWIMMVISFAWVGSYTTSGATALFELTHFPQGWGPKAGTLFWAYLIIFGFLMMIFFSKVVYNTIERLMKILIIICFVGVLIAVIQPQVLQTANDFFHAYFNPLNIFISGMPINWNHSDNNVLLTAICFAGMGGFLNVMYSYWIRDKGIGMSNLINPVKGLFTGGTEVIQEVGYFFEDTPENKENYTKWLKCIRIDNGLAVSINALMAMIMCWLAWAILLPKGEYPSGWQIAVVQSKFFELSMGHIGRIIFLVIAVAFLCDGWLRLTDACARIHADFFRTMFAFTRKYSFKKLYYFFVVTLTIISCVTIPLAEPGPLLLLGGIFNFIAMAIYCPALIYINYFLIPKTYPSWTRPSISSLILIGTVSIIYIIISIWYIATIF